MMKIERVLDAEQCQANARLRAVQRLNFSEMQLCIVQPQHRLLPMELDASGTHRSTTMSASIKRF